MAEPNKESKVLIFILTYNAANHIVGVLDRIPRTFWNTQPYDTEVLIIDDASKDNTVEICAQYAQDSKRQIRVLSNPTNQGYGGNQKLGYTYAIEQGFDVVVMLHGDGQYPPEQIEEIITPIINGHAEAVFGSRMLKKKDALKGGMPYYKFLGNVVLTKLQNVLIGSNLSEFHSGYRAYKVSALNELPFKYNSNDFDFDTHIIIQFLDTKRAIAEIPIPTHYGDEVCHVNGVKYALQVARSTILSRMQPLGIYYNPRFDYTPTGYYEAKLDFDSSHQFAINEVVEGSTVLDFGCGDGHIAKCLKEQKNATVYGYDIYQSKSAVEHCDEVYVTDLDEVNWQLIRPADSVLLLDIIEHLRYPEQFLTDLRLHTCNTQPTIIITTGNVVFLLTRLSFLIGQFNYGKRGILDLDHKRLFTFSSLKRMLENHGFEIEKTEGIPVPIPFIIGNNATARCLLKLNRLFIRLSKGLFSYQIAMVVRPKPTLEMLLSDAKNEGRKRVKKALSKS